MDMREQKFGIEIEMTGITRQRAAEAVAELFGTRAVYDGGYYQTVRLSIICRGSKILSISYFQLPFFKWRCSC